MQTPPYDPRASRREAMRTRRAARLADPARQRNVGLLLLVIGIVALVGTVAQSQLVGVAFLLGLGILFLLWGLRGSNSGLIVPGSLLTSLGVAYGLIQLQLVSGDKTTTGGVYALALGIGFLAILPLSTMTRRQFAHSWAAIPGLFLTASGIYLLAGQPIGLLNAIGRYFFPVALIIAGIALLLGWRRRPPTTKPGA